MPDKEIVDVCNFSFFVEKFSTVLQKIAICRKTNFFGTFWLFFLKSMVI